MQTQVKRYIGSKKFQADAKQMSRQGWTVISTMEHKRRNGCMRIILLGGIGALVFPPKPEIVVTYQRQ